ncbi:MAG: tetratricopeptide repeat protein, partial [Cyanobacteria bacterium J06621_12]
MSHTIGQAKQDTQESNSNSNQSPQDSLISEASSSEAISGLSDADYEFLFNQLLEGIAHGWHDRRIIKFFKQLGDRGQQQDWVAWLDRLRNKVLSLPIQSKRQLGTMMIRLGELTQSAPEVNQIGAASHRIGRELLFGNTPAEIWEYVGPDLTPSISQIETEQELSARLPNDFAALGAEAVDEAKLDLTADHEQNEARDSASISDPSVSAEVEGLDEMSGIAQTTAESVSEQDSSSTINVAAPTDKTDSNLDLDLDLDLDISDRETNDQQNIDTLQATPNNYSEEDEQDLSLASDASAEVETSAAKVDLDPDLDFDLDLDSNEDENIHTLQSTSDASVEVETSTDEIDLDLDLDLDDEQYTSEQVTSYGEEFEFELDPPEGKSAETLQASPSLGVAADLLPEQPISSDNKLSEALQAFELETETNSEVKSSLVDSAIHLEQEDSLGNRQKVGKSRTLDQQSEMLADDTIAEQKLDESSLEVIESWFNLGLKQVSVGEYDKAIASWDKALTINADLAEAWHNRGSALGRLGDYEAAVESFQNALKIDPDNYQAWNDRAHALYQLQKWSSAIESWSQAIKIMPGNHLFWYNRGCALEQLAKWQDAIASYEKALEIKPDFQPGRSRYINLVA